MSVSFQWEITPTGVASSDGKEVITRLVYNLIASDGTGAKGDLGPPGIIYFDEPVPAEEVTAERCKDHIAARLGPDTMAVYKRIAEKNLASFVGESLTVGV